MDERPLPIEAILIAGPTASGKSGLALRLARDLGGVVVNTDALQVYADLHVLSARPSADDEAAAPHALYGHVDGAEPYAVGRWLDEVRSVLSSLSMTTKAPLQQRRFPDGASAIPIFVGGTGLYFNALTVGLASVPEIPVEVRQRWRTPGPDVDLHAELARRDPAMAARLRPSDPQRLMRALEVIDATGRSLSAWQEDGGPGLIDPRRALRLVLTPDRDALEARMVRRLEAMISAGARDEAERLVLRGVPADAPVMKALGVAPLAAWARGEIDREAALERTRLDTRRYAKRQRTWFRNRMADWLHVAPEDAPERAMRELEARRRGPA